MKSAERQGDLAAKLVEDFECGKLNRRELVARLMGLGAAVALTQHAAAAGQERKSMFHATGLDHVALDVTDVPRSRDFYVEHLGLNVLRDGGKDHCFLGRDTFFLALFHQERSGLNHYCYAIQDYNPDEAVEKLKAAGLKPRREADRVYFDDPDGIEVQIAQG